MSAAEFEIYLAVLGRTLALSARERRELVAEIKDHFDERLGELLDAGVERQRAVRMVLDDFGEAAELAARFSEIAERRNQRRWMMRAATGTFATAAVFMAGLFFIGGAPAPMPIVAQTTAVEATPPGPPGVAGASSTTAVQEVAPRPPAAESPLVKTMPLTEVIAALAKVAELEVVIDPKALEAAPGAKARLGALGVRIDKISPKAAQQVLTVLIDSLGPEVDFDVLDGVLVVAHPSVLTTTKAYKLPTLIEKSVDTEQVLDALESMLEAHEQPVAATQLANSVVLTLNPRGHRRVAGLFKELETALNPPAPAVGLVDQVLPPPAATLPAHFGASLGATPLPIPTTSLPLPSLPPATSLTPASLPLPTAPSPSLDALAPSVSPPPIAPPTATILPPPTAPLPAATEPTPIAPLTPALPPTPITPTPIAPTPIAPTPIAPTPIAPTPIAPTPIAPATPAVLEDEGR